MVIHVTSFERPQVVTSDVKKHATLRRESAKSSEK